MLHCRGINFVLSALAFNIIPTIFEVGLVTGVLVCPCRLVAVGTLSCSAIMNVCDCICCIAWYIASLAALWWYWFIVQ